MAVDGNKDNSESLNNFDVLLLQTGGSNAATAPGFHQLSIRRTNSVNYLAIRQ